MDRRLIGAVLVVAVLAAAIVVPARGGLRISGIGTMVELPADPVVGDCVFEFPVGFWAGAGPGSTGGAAAASSPGAVFGPLGPDFGPCAGQSAAGEVAAVVTVAGDAATRGRWVETGGADCRAAALRYAGLESVGGHYTPPGGPAADPVSWSFSVNVRNAWVLPPPTLRAAGRTWAACVIAPARATSYQGGLGAAYAGGTLPDEFGVCWNSRVVSAATLPVDCRQPHLAELVSVGVVPDRAVTTAADIRSSCQRLTARVMGRVDPTDAGGLTVMLSPDSLDDMLQHDPLPDVICYIATTALRVGGTLVGLGDRSIRYSG